jgi:drug/metabolite transporter (DMT)-like permease
MLLMIIGSGFPYLIVAGIGMTMVPVADGSTLLPGLNPVFVSLLGLLFLGRKIPRKRLIALSIIILGVGSMIVASVNHPSGMLFEGLLVLMAASLMWATFTLAFEKSGLKPIEGAAVVTFGSLPLLAASLLWRYEPLQILEVDPASLIPLFIAQGIGVGLLSTISYTTAIKNLGALPASLVGALTPVVSTLLAMVLLSETPILLTLGGMLFVVVGVYLANRH